MTTKRADKERIFTAALELEDPAQRQAFLDAACGEDRHLRVQVEALLKHDDEAGSFIERPAVASPGTIDYQPVTEGPGTIIGPYKLLQKIGEGGFGVVYMAEQQQPVRRKVALKIIKPGMDTREVIARFESERQALALMDHPNIAKVLDAGATASSRPYFVMELVKGVPITEYCDKNNLATDKRLELFLAVCHAVQHAHQKGVIHRDIKPTNVMVTLHDGKPVPKVIDFGVAKATSQQLTERTLFTAYGQMIGTPVYMSPEQAEMSGLDIDTRSDIYSLGVLLYELLTGTTPFDGKRLRDAGYAEMQRIIREEEPPRPSTRVSTMGAALTIVSNQRSTEPGKLRQMLRGDLDLIVMKAMEKERTRRYETPNSFAQDVERFLNHEAILARPQSTAYKLRKFAQRNKAAVASGTAIAAALLLGTIVSALLAIDAYGQRNLARKSLADLKSQQVKTEKERQKAVMEATRAIKAEALAAERAIDAEKARAAEAELAKAADEKRRAIEQQKNEIEGLNQKLKLAMDDQRRAIYAAEMNLVRLEAQRGNLPRLRELLMEQLPGPDQEDLRGWEWTYWYRFLNQAEVLLRFEGFVYGSPDSRLAVVPQGNLAARTHGDQTDLLEISTGKVIGSVPVRQAIGVNRTSIAQNGWLVATSAISQAAYWPGTYRRERATEIAVWDPTGERHTYSVPPDTIRYLSYIQLSQDGARLAAIGNDVSHDAGNLACRILVWDVPSKELVFNQLVRRELNRLAFSPDGSLLAAWVCHSTLRHSDQPRDVATVFTVATGEVQGVARHNDDVDHAYFLPDGKQLLLSTLGYSGANRKELLIWNVGAEAPRRLTSELMPDYVKGVVSPDGRLFAVSGHSVSTIRLIDTQRGNVVSTLHNEATTIDSLTFSADGKQLIAASTGGQVLRWDLGRDDDLFRLRSQPLGPLAYSGYAISPDRSLLAYVTSLGSVRVRTVEGNESTFGEDNWRDRGSARLKFSPNGKYLAVHTNVGLSGLPQQQYVSLELFDVSGGKRLWRYTPTSRTTSSGGVSQLDFTSDSAHILLTSARAPFVRLDCATGKPQTIPLTNDSPGFAHMWAVHSGRLLTASMVRVRSKGSAENFVMVSELLSGDAVGQVSIPAGTTSYSFTGSPDGRHLAICRTRSDLVEVWDFLDQRQVCAAAGSTVVYSADGQLAAIAETAAVSIGGVGVSSGTLRRIKSLTVWEVASGRQLSRISLAGNHADEMRFSPDGRRLLTLHGKQAMGDGGAIPEGRLWDVSCGREIMAIAVAEVNHYIWDFFYDPSGNRLTLLVLAKSMGTSGGWGSTVLNATPLSADEDAQLIARRLVKDLLSESPLPSDAIDALRSNPKLKPLVRDAAVALAQRQPLVPDVLATYAAEVISRFDAPAQEQQAALRCAQALSGLEPKSARSKVLLAGGQFRTGQTAEALATLRDSTADLSEDLSEQEKVLAACREALLVLMEHQQGNSTAARERASQVMDFSRQGISTSVNTEVRSLMFGLLSEVTLVVGPVPTTSRPSGFVMSDETLTRLFERYDSDRDGQLTTTEGSRIPIWSDLLAADENHNGQLTLHEFIVAMRSMGAAGSGLGRSTPRTVDPNVLLLLQSNCERAEYERELASALEKCKLDDGNRSAWNQRGYAHYRLGQYAEALTALERAQQIQAQSGGTPDPGNLLFLAMTHHQLKHAKQARELLLQSDAAARTYQADAPAWQLVIGEAQSLLGIELAVMNSVPIDGWGQAVDPLGDCRVSAAHGKLEFSIPKSVHDLNASGKDWNAPRVLQGVTGDFLLEVKVACDLKPQTIPAGGRIAYHGAGLLVWADPLHFLRVERNAYLLGSEQQHYAFVPSIEHVQLGNSGRTIPRSLGIGFHQRHTWLRLERRGSQFTISMSHDGQKWEPPIETTFEFPDRVWVGVTAVNYSLDPLDVEFSEFKLTALSSPKP